MEKAVTFGEIMLRLAPQGYNRFVQEQVFGATYGGGEANVAVSLANFGVDAAFVTKLPKHEIGQAAVNSLPRAITYLERAGIAFDYEGAKKDPKGNITALYLKEEILGFALQLVQAK